jgi:hypothetical protein
VASFHPRLPAQVLSPTTNQQQPTTTKIMTTNKKTMTTAIVHFPLPPGIPADAVKSGFLEIAPLFQEPPGLLRKYFLLSADGETGGGVYLWTSRQTAFDFSETTIRPMIKEKFHVEPAITYFETPVVVDNISSQILS